MSRFRSYGQARGTRTYLSRRDEFGMSEEEKHAAYLKRKTTAESARKAGVGRPLTPYRMADSTAAEQARAIAEAKELAAAHAQRDARAAPEQTVPQSVPTPGDLFADLADDEEEEMGEAPAP